MTKQELLGLELVRINEADAQLIMEWRNDPVSLKMSYHEKPKQWDLFWEEFQQKYFSQKTLPPLFVVSKGARVALLYFDLVKDPLDSKRKCCAISIIVAPKHRQQGIGKRALKEVESWVKQQGYDTVYAEAKKENTASHAAFSAAGFSDLGEFKKQVFGIDHLFSIHKYLKVLNETPSENANVFIIAEAGSNWRLGTYRRDLAMAKSLIETAKEAQADAVKFQVYRPESVYVHNAGKSNYLADAGIMEDIQTIFADHAMPVEMIEELSEYCKSCDIEFMSSPFSKKDFANVDPFVVRHKIASYEISHIRLIELAAASLKPTIISTGASTLDEIAWAVHHFQKSGGQKLSLMQCTAKYPADSDAMNLRVIPQLQQYFKIPVGLSDHSRDPFTAPLGAVALGAAIVEKHFTLSNNLPGPDHYFAILPHELKEMVKQIRDLEAMLGSRVKEIDESEYELRNFAKRGVQALCDIHQGDTFSEGKNIGILRSGNQKLGVHPMFLKNMEGKKAKRAISAGSGVELNDWG